MDLNRELDESLEISVERCVSYVRMPMQGRGVVEHPGRKETPLSANI